MAIVCSVITSINRTKHTHKQKQVHKINILHVSWTWVQCVRRLSHYPVTPDDDAIHRRSCRWTIAVVSAMPWQLFVSVRRLRRNFDDSRPSAEGHPRWRNQPGSNPSYSVAICRRSSMLGPRGPRLPQFVAGPQIFEVSIFYHRHSVCDVTKRPSGQAAVEF